MNTDSELEVHVAEDEIIVAQPGSAYAVTFYKLTSALREANERRASWGGSRKG
jgi:hypothetical protein